MMPRLIMALLKCSLKKLVVTHRGKKELLHAEQRFKNKGYIIADGGDQAQFFKRSGGKAITR